MNALIYGMGAQIIAATATLLLRAGFEVDIISADPQVCRAISHREIIIARSYEHFIDIAVSSVNNKPYLLCVPTEDRVIDLLRCSGLGQDLKLKLLPVTSHRYYDHLYSKINLSRVLRSSGIVTPDFREVVSKEDLLTFDAICEKPYLIKKDRSGGGAGIVLIDEGFTVRHALRSISLPALMQKYVEGDLLDLSAFFYKNQLIYFHCSEMLLSRPGKFGLSILRKYYRSSHIGDGYYRDLCALGHALGIDGFTNISAIRSWSDGKLYFIEADLRPNLWIEHGLFIGEDPADYIREFFASDRLVMPRGLPGYGYHLDDSQALEVPLYCRMTEKEVSGNAYNCNAFRRDYHDVISAETQEELRPKLGDGA